MTALFKRSADNAGGTPQARPLAVSAQPKSSPHAWRSRMRFLNLNQAEISVHLELVEGLVQEEVLSFLATLRRDMRPTAHSLSFASPKESKQRKGDPESGGPGVPGLLCAARSSREVQKLALRAQTSELLDPSCPALLDASHGDSKSQHQQTARLAAPNIAAHSFALIEAMRSEPKGIGSSGPLRRAEQRSGRRIKKFRCLSPQGEFLNFPPPASSARQPRYSGAEERGRLFFAYFLLAKQKKVSALSGAHPDAVQRKQNLVSKGRTKPRANERGSL
jgi:hypothetical protein